MTLTIKSMSNHYTPKQLIIIAEALSIYSRYADNKQTRYEVNKLQQIFTEANRIKAATK